MGSQIRFPTILGLGVLLVGLVVGVYLVMETQIFSSQASTSTAPQEILVSNVTGNSVTISWKTEGLTPGFIQAGPQTNLGITFLDVRDTDTPQPHQLHYVTLTGLQPNSPYYYKIVSGGEKFPVNETPSFQTATETTVQDTPPLIGRVLDSSQKPVNEALLTLQVPGAQVLTAITTTAGNFVLPLAQIRKQDLVDNYVFGGTPIISTLVATNGTALSSVQLKVPTAFSSLPDIILGQNQDLTNQPDPAPLAAPAAKKNKYDLDGDSAITPFDRGIVIKNVSAKNPDLKADLDGNGKVDATDVDIITQQIPKR